MATIHNEIPVYTDFKVSLEMDVNSRAMDNFGFKILALCCVLFLRSTCCMADVIMHPAEQQSEMISFAFSTDGKLLAGSDAKAIHVWNAQTGELLRSLKDFGGAYKVAFSHDGSMLAAAFVEGEYRHQESKEGYNDWVDRLACIWDVGTWTLAHKLISGKVLSVAFAPDDNTIAVGCTDNRARLWDTKTGELKYKLPLAAYLEGVTSVAFSPDGNILAGIGGNSRTVSLWSTQTGKLIKVLNKKDPSAFPPRAMYTLVLDWHWQEVGFSSNGKAIVVGGGGGRVLCLDIKSGKLTKNSLNRQRLFSSTMSLSSDGSVLATSDEDRILLRYVRNGQLKKTVRRSYQPFALSANGASLAAIQQDKSIHVIPIK